MWNPIHENAAEPDFWAPRPNGAWRRVLSTARRLVVFPEGEIYHTNERLTPLREGVAFMAGTAQKDLDKEANGRKVWIVPTAIRYTYLEDVTPALEESMTELEAHMHLRPG